MSLTTTTSRAIPNRSIARSQQPHVAGVVGTGEGKDTDIRRTVDRRPDIAREPLEPRHALVEADRLVGDRRPTDGRQQRSIVRDERGIGLRVSAVDREDYHGTVSTGATPSSSIPT